MEKIYNRFGVLLALFLLQFNYSILAQCNAIITSNSQAKGCSPFTLQLTDASTGVVTNRVWNFGDGSATSGTQNPIHTFTTSASGNDTTYTVSLKVYCVGNDSSVTTFSVLVYSPPKVAFTSNKFSFCSFSDTVCFTNTSEFSLLHSYLWNFGDNTSSTQYSPCKVFTNTGSYNIQLIVTDSNSCQQTLLKTNYVTAKKAPNPDFTVTPQLGCNPLPTSITNTTNTLQDTIASWSWDFGDGTTSSQQNPAAHTYTLAPDTATITLFATNNLGCKNSTTKVVVIKPTPVALFTMPIEICLGSSANIVFTGSASTGATYTWSFNGGTVNSGTGAGPYSVSWNSQGVKTVTLTVNDNGCSATYVKSINVNNLPPVTLTTNTGSDTICNGVPIVFTASPSNYAAYHFFLNSGSVQNTNSNTYTNASLNNNDQISVQVTDIKGCVSTLSATKTIKVKPIPTVTLTALSDDSICVGSTALFSALPAGLDNYIFYDGFASVQSGASTALTYGSAQTFTVTVVATEDGCNSLPSNAIKTTIINNLPAPILNCGGSNLDSLSFVWSMVNGAQGYEISINGGAYSAPSSGSLGLTHLLSGLNPNDSATATIRAIGTPPCGNSMISNSVTCFTRICDPISFTLSGPTTICGNQAVTAIASNILPSTYAINWNSGAAQGVTTFSMNVTTDTTFTASVTNTAQPTCPSFTQILTVDLNQLPTPVLTNNAGNDSVCSGQQVVFTANPATYDNYAFYNGLGLVQNGPNPVFTANNLLSTSVLQVIATEQGCTGVASNTVSFAVIPPLQSPQVTCGNTTNTSIEFDWNSVTGATGYEISINGGAFTTASSGGNGLTHLITGATQGSSATIEVKALGGQPCGNSVISFAQTCYAQNCTAISFNAPTQINLCEGDTVNTSISGINISNYSTSWNNGAAGTSLTYSIAPTNNITIPVSVTNLSEALCPSATKYISVQLTPLPVVSITSSASNDSTCSGTPISFTANPQVYSSYSFYENFALMQSGTNPVYTTSNLLNGKTVKVLVSNQGCADTSTNTIATTVIVPLPAPQVNCGTTTNSTIVFTWDAVPDAQGYMVSVNNSSYTTPSSGTNGLLHTITGLNTGDSATIVVMALGKAPCGNSAPSNAQTCYAIPCTGITFTLSGTTQVCQATQAIASISNITPATFNSSWNGGVFGSTTSYSVVPTTDTTIHVVLKNTAEPLCPTADKSISVDFINKPVVTLSLSASNDSVCFGVPITLTASPATYDNYQFYNATSSLASSANPVYITNNISGTYSFYVVSNFMGCLDTSAANSISIVPLPFVTFSASVANDSICQGAPYTLTVSPAGLSNYQFTYNGSTVQNSSSNAYTTSGLAVGNNQILVTASDYLGCSNTPADTATVVVLPYTSVTLAANATGSICNHQTVLFTASPSGLNQYTFYLNNSVVQNGPSNVYTNNTLTTTDTVRVTSTNSIGCASSKSNGYHFVINPTADPAIDNNNDTLYYCVSSATALQLSASVDTALYNPVTYYWSTNQQTKNISVNPTQSTWYSVYTVFNGCPSLLDSVLVLLDNQAPPTVSASSSVQGAICLGDSILLTGTSNGLYSVWLNGTNDTVSKTSSVVVKPITDSVFVFRSSNKGCATTISVPVKVDKCLTDLSGPIPQIITPNGDGANDNWIVPDIDYFQENKLMIYNRWGQLVYSQSPYLNTWTGTDNSNNELSEGSYYYVLDLGGNYDKKFVGFVVIHR